MENPQERKYEVIITKSSEISFYEIIEYLYENFPFNRAEEIANEIRDKTKSLQFHARRGTPESRLIKRKEDYRFVLYNRSTRAEIKII